MSVSGSLKEVRSPLNSDANTHCTYCATCQKRDTAISKQRLVILHKIHSTLTTIVLATLRIAPQKKKTHKRSAAFHQIHAKLNKTNLRQWLKSGRIHKRGVFGRLCGVHMVGVGQLRRRQRGQVCLSLCLCFQARLGGDVRQRGVHAGNVVHGRGHGGRVRDVVLSER